MKKYYLLTFIIYFSLITLLMGQSKTSGNNPSVVKLTGWVPFKTYSQKEKSRTVYLLKGNDTLKTYNHGGDISNGAIRQGMFWHAFDYDSIKLSEDLVLYVKKKSEAENGDVFLYSKNSAKKLTKFIESKTGYTCNLLSNYWPFITENYKPVTKHGTTKKDPKPCGATLLIDKYKDGDIIPKEDVGKLTKTLGAYFICDHTIYPVLSYQFSAVINGNSVVYKGTGNTLTNDMRRALGSVTTGSKIFFDNVKTKSENGSIINVSGAIFKIGPSSNSKKEDITNDISAKVLYGAKKNIPLTDNKVYLTSSKGDTLKTTRTNEYGDFEFKKVNTQNANIVVAMSDKIKDEKEIYLAKQNGTIISTFKKTANGFIYRILPSDAVKLNSIEVEDTELKIDAFTKSTDKTITVAENIYYPTNEYKVTPDIAKNLDVIANSLKKNKEFKLEIYSHTDSNGDDASNLELSSKRATAVLEYITSRGVDKGRLTAKGMGENEIINRCVNGVSCSEKEHELNRRTEFKFIK